MSEGIYVIAIDIGTTGVKTCLFNITDKITLLCSELRGYNLYVLEDGGAEQDPNEWWEAICLTTRDIIKNSNIPADKISGVSFCSQMQGLVLVDKDGMPVRRAMSYMDQRAYKEHKDGISHGLKVANVNIVKLLRSLQITGAVAASVKDPVWKYKWVESNEPGNFKRVYKWLDVKEYIISRFTGEYIMTEGSAFATLLYDTRRGKGCWSKSICNMLGVNMDHLPKIVKSTDVVGYIIEVAAIELGLEKGTPVFGGGGDAELIGIGAGAIDIGSTHVYLGTSGWVSTVIDRQKVDVNTMIAGIVGAQTGLYNYFAEMETAGKCLEWVKDHLALDEIGIYLEKKQITESIEKVYTSLYDYVCKVVKEAKAGCDGVIFTPWLHGNRCPFEDPNARGMFFNISLFTGKTELIRAVIEGVCYHNRWMLEAQDRLIKTSDTIRFVGGGALAETTCQILSDVLGRKIETVENPQNVGAVGAAIIIAIGLKEIESFSKAKSLITVKNTYTPNLENKEIYDKNYIVFKNLYKYNKKNYRLLNH